MPHTKNRLSFSRMILFRNLQGPPVLKYHRIDAHGWHGAPKLSLKRNLFVVSVKIYFRPRQECEFGPLANIASYRDRKILAHRPHRTFWVFI